MTETFLPKRPELSLSVFFPAYNEEGNIVELLKSAEKILRQITYRYELIVVDDGSSDNTRTLVEEMQIWNPRIRLIEHGTNRGYGAALVSGIRSARYDWIFFTDADRQFDLQEIEKLLEHIPSYSVVIGYRAPRRDPFMRLVNAKGWNILNRILFGLKVRDIDCAFKLFRRDLIANLPIASEGAMISAEVLIRLSREGVIFKEVPVTHLPRKAGSPTGAKPSVILRAFREMISLYMRGSLGRDNATTEMVKFGMVGLLNTALDIALYFFLTRYTLFFANHLLSAKFISFFMGTVSSFYLNRNFTFGMTDRISAVEVVKFYSTVGAGIVINVLALYVFNGLFHFYDLLAVAIATVLTFIWGFLFSKFWVFAKDTKKSPLKQGIAHGSA